MITLFRSDSSPVQTAELRVAALSSDTASYLSTRAGTIIEAKVVRVVTQLAGSNPNTSASISPGSTTTPKANAETYRVELLSEGKPLVVESSLAPRRGQLLRLEVLDAQNLRILLDPGSTSKTQNPVTDKNTRGQTGSSQSPAASASAIPGKRVTAEATNSLAGTQPPGKSAANTSTGPTNTKNLTLKIQSALRDSLPKQAENASLQKSSEWLRSLTTLLQNNSTINPPSTDKPLPQTTDGYSQLVRSLANTLLNVQTGAAQTKLQLPVAGQTIKPGTQTPPNPQPTQQRSASVTTPSTTAIYTRTVANQATQQSVTGALRELFIVLQNQASQQLNPATLGTPNGVRNAILNSGLFYEAKLLNAIVSSLPPEIASSGNQVITGSPERRESITEIIRNISASLRPGSNQAPQITNDSKFQQLQLSRAIATVINRLQDAANSQQQKLEATRDIQISALWDIVQRTVQTTSNDSTAEKGLADALVQILKLTLAQTARTQSQQLFSLGSQLASGEGPSTQSLNYSIPLWINNQFKPLDLVIERDEEQPNPNRRERSPAWNVRLRFDLDELGELVALASLREKTLNAVFWAEKQVLVTKVEAGFNTLASTLTAAGISVNQIFCRVGKPEITDSYSITQQLADSLLNTQI